MIERASLHEVALSLQGELAPAVGLDTLAGFPGGADSGSGKDRGKGTVLEGVDRVQYETRAGVGVTRLTKYISQGTPIS